MAVGYTTRIKGITTAVVGSHDVQLEASKQIVLHKGGHDSLAKPLHHYKHE